LTQDYYFDARVAEAYDQDIAPAGAVVQDDIPFYVELAREAGSAGQRVLELGCGTGRVTIPIAEAGVEVVGLDNSRAMLAVAERKAKAAGVTGVSWQEGDMARFRLDGAFGLVIIPFRSFLLLLTVEQQKACLARIREHLIDGGRLALNIFNPSIPYIADWLGARKGSWQRSMTEARREFWFSRAYDASTQQLDEARLEVKLDDAGSVIARVERNLRVRWVYRYEMEHLLALSGFEIEALYGWFDRRPFIEESQDMVWLARRR
jgi:ubiquinone/menaquinone biosynthesis C-methylase UbiE